MHILFVGVFEPPQSSHHPMVRELRALGHDVEEFDYRRIDRECLPRWARGGAYRTIRKLARRAPLPRFAAALGVPGMRRMNDELLARCRRNHYDLVLLAKAELVEPRLLEYINERSRTWYFFMDSLAIAREFCVVEHARRASFSSATRGNVAALFERAGGRSMFLTQGTDPELFCPGPGTPATTDVVFVGRNKPHRDAVVRHLREHGIAVVTYGRDCDNPPVYGEALRDVYRGARIALNLNSDPGSTGFSLRVFQVLGTGTMLVSEYGPDLPRLFARGRDMEWFTRPDECLALVQRYLDDADARGRIAAAGRATVLQRFTWRHVMQTICDRVESS